MEACFKNKKVWDKKVFISVGKKSELCDKFDLLLYFLSCGRNKKTELLDVNSEFVKKKSELRQINWNINRIAREVRVLNLYLSIHNSSELQEKKSKLLE